MDLEHLSMRRVISFFLFCNNATCIFSKVVRIQNIQNVLFLDLYFFSVKIVLHKILKLQF